MFGSGNIIAEKWVGVKLCEPKYMNMVESNHNIFMPGWCRQPDMER